MSVRDFLIYAVLFFAVEFITAFARRFSEQLCGRRDSERPNCVKWEATPTTELLDGLAPTLPGPSPTGIDTGGITELFRRIRAA